MLRFVVATEEPAEERDGTTRGRSYIVPDLEHRLPGRGHYLLPSKQTLKDLTGRLRCVAARRSHRLSARARYRRRSRLMPARPAAPVPSSSAVHRSHISSRFAKQSVLPLPHYETVVVDKLKVRAPAKGAGAWYPALSDLEADRVEMCPSQRLIDDDRHARYREVNILKLRALVGDDDSSG